jgi:hypothetical protein
VKENHYLYKEELYTDYASGNLMVNVALPCLQVYNISISTIPNAQSLEVTEANRQLTIYCQSV